MNASFGNCLLYRTTPRSLTIPTDFCATVIQHFRCTVSTSSPPVPVILENGVEWPERAHSSLLGSPHLPACHTMQLCATCSCVIGDPSSGSHSSEKPQALESTVLPCNVHQICSRCSRNPRLAKVRAKAGRQPTWSIVSRVMYQNTELSF